MIRPEVNAFIRVLPFLEFGGGIGRHMVFGESSSEKSLGELSCWAFNIQARVGE